MPCHQNSVCFEQIAKSSFFTWIDADSKYISTAFNFFRSQLELAKIFIFLNLSNYFICFILKRRKRRPDKNFRKPCNFLTNLRFWEIGSYQSKDILNPYLFRGFSDLLKIHTGPNKLVFKFVAFGLSPTVALHSIHIRVHHLIFTFIFTHKWPSDIVN